MGHKDCMSVLKQVATEGGLQLLTHIPLFFLPDLSLPSSPAHSPAEITSLLSYCKWDPEKWLECMHMYITMLVLQI